MATTGDIAVLPLERWERGRDSLRVEVRTLLGRDPRVAAPLDTQSTDWAGSSTGWLASPRVLIERWTTHRPTAIPFRWRPAAAAVAQSLAALIVHTGRDLTLIVAAHTDIQPDTPFSAAPDGPSGNAHRNDQSGRPSRRSAIIRGRTTAVILRQVRARALDVVLEQAHAEDRVEREIRARRRARLIALAALAVVLLAALVIAPLAAHRIGIDLTPTGGTTGWLAGQFDALGRWWDGLNPAEKVLLGLGVAALVTLSGGSLGLAIGLSGATTYAAEHGRGVASLIRDPEAAASSWWKTTTPAGAVLDLAEFGLTFLPTGIVGGTAGRELRTLGLRGADLFGDWRYFRGGWEGPNGLRLSADEFRAAQEALGRSAAAEPAITARLAAITHDLPSGELVGLDYRLKATDSLARKVATQLDAEGSRDVSQALGAINDDVRYTIQTASESYTHEVTQAVSGLQDSGYELFKWKNTWGGNGYQGINSFWRDPATGQTFEVQFHTPASFDAKMVTHQLFEEARIPGIDPALRDSLNAQQGTIFGAVPRPPGAVGLDPGATP